MATGPLVEHADRPGWHGLATSDAQFSLSLGVWAAILRARALQVQRERRLHGTPRFGVTINLQEQRVSKEIALFDKESLAAHVVAKRRHRNII